MVNRDFSQAAFPPDEPERLAALYALEVLDTAPDREVDAIAELAADRFDAPIALVSLVDSDRQWFKARVGLDVCETDRASSFCAHTILQDDVFVVLDARDDPRFAGNPLVVGDPHIRFYAAAPLITGQGKRIGTLCVIDRRPRAAFDARDRRALRLMAEQTIHHLEYLRLARSQRMAELIGDTTTDAFVCTDAHSHIVYWNEAAEQMFGWSAAEALGETIDLIVPDRHRGAHHGGMARLRGGAPTRLVGETIEVPATTRAGHELPVELSLGMWRDEESNLPAGFVAIIRDVSARKRLEAERDATQERLAEQVAAIEAAHDGIAITDRDGCFVFMNSSHATMFGYPDRAAPLGLPWSDLYGPEELDRLTREAMPTLERTGQWRGEATGRRRDGTPIEQEISLSLRSNGGIVCVTRDISARLEAEREKARMREQLLIAQRHEAVGQLASGIAHDFNNLIAAISVSAALVQRAPDAATRTAGERIQSAAGAAASLVDKMLSLGARKPKRERLDLRRVVADTGDLLRASLPAQHRLLLSLPEAPVIAAADATELMQVVLNLGINARDALRDRSEGRITIEIAPVAPGDPVPALALGTRPRGPAARISVIDTGCGIAEADLDTIFQPYVSCKRDAGTGLGLAVVAGIVAGSGGGLAVRSTRDAGTVFDVFWPLDPPALLALAPAATAGAGRLDGHMVLVADDNPAVVEQLTDLFERAGAEVGPCVDPRDALAALEDDPLAWTLLVTDYNMPGMSGAELAAAAWRLRPDLPVLLCTALPDAYAGTAGFDAVTGKPIAADRLIAAAQSAIAQRGSLACVS